MYPGYPGSGYPAPGTPRLPGSGYPAQTTLPRLVYQGPGYPAQTGVPCPTLPSVLLLVQGSLGSLVIPGHSWSGKPGSLVTPGYSWSGRSWEAWEAWLFLVIPGLGGPGKPGKPGYSCSWKPGEAREAQESPIKEVPSSRDATAITPWLDTALPGYHACHHELSVDAVRHPESCRLAL